MSARKEIERVKAPIDTILLDDIARGIKKILTHLDETTPQGKHVVFERDVTKLTTIDVEGESPLGPLYSFDILNKGPDTVKMMVDDDIAEIPVEIDELIPYIRGKRTIKKIVLRIEPNETASIKIIGRS